jgi:hypothetical protein
MENDLEALRELIEYLPIALGFLAPVVMGYLKRIPWLARNIPFEHQKLAVTIGLTFAIAAALNIDATPFYLVREGLAAAGLGAGTYGLSKYNSERRSRLERKPSISN